MSYFENYGSDIFESEGGLQLTKRGKPRKRKPKEPRIYFTQDTENAIMDYLACSNKDERNRIYNERIEYGFYKLAENIIHTFKFYYTDTDTIEELKHEVITFLLEKLHLYNPDKGRAFSYFGTIAKRYLIVYNENNYKKLQEKADVDESDDEQMHLYENDRGIEDLFNENNFMNQYIKYIDTHIYKLFPKKQDAQTADAIIELFRKRETLEIFNKKALYIYIREITDVSTPQITKIIKKLKILYIQLYNEYYQHGYIKI
jgi:DNA-binding transcriptional regulator GbsR (MarR family)